MSLHGLSLLAGVPGKTGGKKFNAVNPATNERLEPAFHEASEAEVAGALDASAAAFNTYRACSGAERAKLLETIAAEIEALGDALLQRANAETGLPLARLTGERGRTCGQLRLFAQVARDGSWVDARIDPALPDRQPLPRADLRRMLIPLGPVVVFGSSNFPLAFSVAGGDTASALAAGCTVVVKAHRAHAGTAELVGGAITPRGRRVRPARRRVLDDSRWWRHGRRFDGETPRDRRGGLHRLARRRPLALRRRQRPSAPDPGLCRDEQPQPGLPHARRPPRACRRDRPGLLGSFTMGVGQFCTKPGLVFAVRGPDTDAFVAKLTEVVRAAPCGTMLTSGIRDAFVENRDKVTAIPGVQPVAAGTAAANPGKTEGQPSVSLTTAKNFLAHPALATEAFGPFTLIVVADTLADFAACAAALEGQLTATLQANADDFPAARPLLAALEQKVGRVLLNGFPTGVEVCHAMNHGGPYPATTDVRYTSVGTAAMFRFARPMCYQSLPDALLPDALKNANPLGLMRLVNGQPTREPLAPSS